MSIQKCREPKAWLVALQVMTPAALSAGSRSLSLRLSQHTTISHGARGPGMVGKSAGTMGVARSSIGDSLKTLQWGENGEQWAAGRASQSLCVPGAPGELWAGPYNGMRTSKCGVCRPGGSVRRWLHGDAQGNMHGSSLTTHAAGSGQPWPQNGGLSSWLAKSCVWVFPCYLTEKSKWMFWPTQYVLLLFSQWISSRISKVSGKSLKSDRTWIQVWIPSLRTWASYRLFWSLSFFIHKMRS